VEGLWKECSAHAVPLTWFGQNFSTTFDTFDDTTTSKLDDVFLTGDTLGYGGLVAGCYADNDLASPIEKVTGCRKTISTCIIIISRQNHHQRCCVVIIWLYSSLSAFLVQDNMGWVIRKTCTSFCRWKHGDLPIALSAIIAALTPALSIIIVLLGPLSESDKYNAFSLKCCYPIMVKYHLPHIACTVFIREGVTNGHSCPSDTVRIVVVGTCGAALSTGFTTVSSAAGGVVGTGPFVCTLLFFSGDW